MYSAEYARPGDDQGIEVCTLTHAGPLPAPWLAAGFVVNLVLDGEADLSSRGIAHRVGPGHIVLANPGQVRAVTRRYTETATTRSVTLDALAFQDAFRARSGHGQPPFFRATTSTSGPLRLALLRLYGAMSVGAARLVREAATEALFDALVGEVEGEERRRWPAHPAVRRAREFVDEHFDEDVGLDDLVRVSGLSRAHLVREFHRRVGMPPHQYQIHARIRKAKELLAKGASVAAVAATIGFFDQAHFARHFRRLVGSTARDYRRAMAA